MILCAILASCNILSYLTNLYIMYDMSTLPVVPVNMRPHKSSFNISPGFWFCIESFILRTISQSFVLQRKPSSFTVSTSAPFLSRINVFHSLAWLNFCIFFLYSLIESKMLGLFILTVIKILVSCVDYSRAAAASTSKQKLWIISDNFIVLPIG